MMAILEPAAHRPGGRRARSARQRGGRRGHRRSRAPCRHARLPARPAIGDDTSVARLVIAVLVVVVLVAIIAWALRGAAAGGRAQGPRGRGAARAERGRRGRALPRRQHRALRGVRRADGRGAGGAVRVRAPARGPSARGLRVVRRRRAPSAGPATLRQVTGGAPIGMFDSGVGGLTVLDACLVRLPHEDFIYLGDTGRFPYGPRVARRAARLRPRALRAARGARREARRGGLQLGHRRGATGAAARGAAARAGRRDAGGPRRLAGDAQPPCRAARDRGHGRERALRGGDPRPRRRHRARVPSPAPGSPRPSRASSRSRSTRSRWCSAPASRCARPASTP